MECDRRKALTQGLSDTLDVEQSVSDTLCAYVVLAASQQSNDDVMDVTVM